MRIIPWRGDNELGLTWRSNGFGVRRLDAAFLVHGRALQRIEIVDDGESVLG